VTGFLEASASYPTFAAIARQYLVGSAGKRWDPGWGGTVFENLNPPTAVTANGGQRATVQVTGTVQATFNGSGEFVSASGQGTAVKPYTFNLVKVNGVWRISNPPRTRLLTAAEFSQDYKPQDLYFVNPDAPSPVLVPDSVFVPLGTTATALATNLVSALLDGPTTWLQGATTSFLPGTKLLGIALDGATAVVNLGGTMARASTALKEQVSAQLLWTLASPQAGLSPPIQSVQLEINGKAWIPTEPICGTSQGQSPVQKQAAYGCYAPYPATSASFSFVGAGSAWSRCGWAQAVAANSIGPLVPVFDHAGRAIGGLPCQDDRPVAVQSQDVPTPPHLPGGTPAAVAVSPDGQEAAYVVPGKDADMVYIRPLGRTASANGIKPLPEQGVTSIGWDIRDNLWLTAQNGVWMVSATGQPVSVSTGNGNVVALKVAPDGVRVALILQVGREKQIVLGAIDRGGQLSASQIGSQPVHPAITHNVQLGTNLTDPVALTWYDADNLLVLAGTGGQNALYEVPVDGQQSSGPLLTPAGAISITAYGPDNAVVAGLVNSKLAVSASLEGPWQTLMVSGSNPAYP
jgi:hypothetical protein